MSTEYDSKPIWLYLKEHNLMLVFKYSQIRSQIDTGQ